MTSLRPCVWCIFYCIYYYQDSIQTSVRNGYSDTPVNKSEFQHEMLNHALPYNVEPLFTVPTYCFAFVTKCTLKHTITCEKQIYSPAVCKKCIEYKYLRNTKPRFLCSDFINCTNKKANDLYSSGRGIFKKQTDAAYYCLLDKGPPH